MHTKNISSEDAENKNQTNESNESSTEDLSNVMKKRDMCGYNCGSGCTGGCDDPSG
jgi:hypothetical protein